MQKDLSKAYLVDFESQEFLRQRVAVLKGIARAEMAIAENRVVTHADAKVRIARWLKSQAKP